MPSNAHYQLSDDFRRPRENRLGLHVRSDLAAGGTLSAQQDALLGSFLSGLLFETGRYGNVVHLASLDSERPVEVIVEVVVSEFHVASAEELAAFEPSRLGGTISLRRTQGAGNALGSARIWATGANLELEGRTSAPDTVRAFAKAMAEIIY